MDRKEPPLKKKIFILAICLLLTGSISQAGRPINRSPALSPGPAPSLTPDESKIQSLRDDQAQLVLKLRKVIPGSKKMTDEEIIHRLPDPITPASVVDQNRQEEIFLRDQYGRTDQEIKRQIGRAEVNATGHAVSNEARRQIEVYEAKKKEYTAEIARLEALRKKPATGQNEDTEEGVGKSLRELRRVTRELTSEQRKLKAGEVTPDELRLMQISNDVDQLLKMPIPRAAGSDSTQVSGIKSKNLNEEAPTLTGEALPSGSNASAIQEK